MPEEKIFKEEEREKTIYDNDSNNEQVDDDEIDSEEAGFMKGYNDSIEKDEAI